MSRAHPRWRHVLPSIALAMVLGGCPAGVRGGAEADVDWPTYGNDPGGTRYSPLAQVDRGNVGRLRAAWTYRTGEAAETEWTRGRFAFEATPIMVDGTLYVSTRPGAATTWLPSPCPEGAPRGRRCKMTG